MVYDIENLYEEYLVSSGVCTDTRTLKSGNIFFALTGPNFDGNEYAEQALKSGARLAVVDRPDMGKLDGCFLVGNVLSTLQLLARHHRRLFHKPVIGITGSNGKTTTKELLYTALSTKFEVHYTKGNLNNHIGVPLTLLSLDHDKHDIAIIEMGANKVGDIAELCSIAEPTHGLITNIGTAHIGGFGGREGIIRGKSELFDFIRKNNGVAFINQNDPVLTNMRKRMPLNYGFPEQETLETTDPVITYSCDGQSYTTALTGAYNFNNICAALVVGKSFGVDKHMASVAICDYVPDNNRSQVILTDRNKVILDAYNANPDSMKAAIESLGALKANKKAVVLGEMKELGDYSLEEHRNVGVLIQELNPELAIFVGSDMFYAHEVNADSSLYFKRVDELIDYLKEQVLTDFLILVKGSRTMTLEKVVSCL